jgi:hypothetical protein
VGLQRTPISDRFCVALFRERSYRLLAARKPHLSSTHRMTATTMDRIPNEILDDKERKADAGFEATMKRRCAVKKKGGGPFGASPLFHAAAAAGQGRGADRDSSSRCPAASAWANISWMVCTSLRAASGVNSTATGEILSPLFRTAAVSFARLGSLCVTCSIELLRGPLITGGDAFTVFRIVLPIALTARRQLLCVLRYGRCYC